MTNSQRLAVKLSEVRSRLNEISLLEGDAFTDEIRQESDKLQGEYKDLENRYRAAVISEGEEETRRRETEPDAEMRARIELRSRASLTKYLGAALSGKATDGAEKELQEAAAVDGIPLELWDVPPVEHRADAVSPAPSTVGVNLAPIAPAVFAQAVVPRLGVSMPRVGSGTYAVPAITTSLTAGTKAKGGAAEASAAALTVQTAIPKRVSARLAVAIEDVAAVGAESFESALRQNLSLVLSDALDSQALTGDGQAPNLSGIFQALTDPSTPSSVAKFDDFVSAFAGGIDGLWASTVRDVGIVCGVDTFKLSAKSFRDVGTNNGHRGAVAFSDYAAQHFGGWWTSSRMPDAASNIQQAILHRKGRAGLTTAVCPHWGEIAVDDIYSGSAKGERYVTFHVLLGDVIVVQSGAYAQVAFKLA